MRTPNPVSCRGSRWRPGDVVVKELNDPGATSAMKDEWQDDYFSAGCRIQRKDHQQHSKQYKKRIMEFCRPACAESGMLLKVMCECTPAERP
jgi:hypothetical protein